MALSRNTEVAAKKAARKNAKRAARVQGCTCDVEILFDYRDHPFQNVISRDGFTVTMRHEEWCPLLRTIQERAPGLARTQVVISVQEES